MLEEIQNLYRADIEKFNTIMQFLMESDNEQIKKEFEKILLHLYLLYGEELSDLLETIDEERKWQKSRHPAWISTPYIPTHETTTTWTSHNTDTSYIKFDENWSTIFGQEYDYEPFKSTGTIGINNCANSD